MSCVLFTPLLASNLLSFLLIIWLALAMSCEGFTPFELAGCFVEFTSPVLFSNFCCNFASAFSSFFASTFCNSKYKTILSERIFNHFYLFWIDFSQLKFVFVSSEWYFVIKKWIFTITSSLVVTHMLLIWSTCSLCVAANDPKWTGASKTLLTPFFVTVKSLSVSPFNMCKSFLQIRLKK